MSDKPKKTKSLLGRIILGIFLLIVLLLAAFYAWAVAAPRSLASYIPQIEESIEDELEGYDIEIAAAHLEWGGFGEFLNVKLENIAINHENGGKVALIPEANLDFKTIPLLYAELDPATVSASKTTVKIDGESVEVRQFDIDFDEKIARFVGEVILGGDSVFLHGNAELGEGDNVVTIFADKLSLQHYSTLLPFLSGADVMLDLKLEAKFRDHNLKQVAFFGSNISGIIENPEILRDKLEVASGNFSGEFEIEDNNLKIEYFALNFTDGAKISIAGEGNAEDNFTVTTNIDQMIVTNLYKYWPKDVSDNAILWIQESIKAGTITTAQAKFAMRPWYTQPNEETGEDVLTIPKDALDMQFNFTGFEVVPARGLAPITNGVGYGSMDMQTLITNVESADMNGSKVSETKIVIDGIGVLPIEEFTATGKVEGSPKTLVAFYERAHPKDAMIRTNEVEGGSATSTAKISFPLDEDLLLKDIGIVLDSQIINATADSAKLGVKASALNVKLTMDDKGYELDGNVVIQPNKAIEHVEVKSIPLKFNVSDKNNIEQYIIDADLSSATIKLEDYAIKKKAGDSARLQLTARKKPKFSDIQNFKFSSNALKLEGEGGLLKDMSDFTSLNFYTIAFGKSNLSGKVVRDGQGLKIYMTGDYFNAAPLIDSVGEAASDKKSPPLYMELKLDELEIAKEKSLKDVAITIFCRYGDCEEVELNSDLLQVNKTAAKLKVTASDAGDVLAAFDAYDYMTGGELLVDADIKDGKYTGNAKITKFKIKQNRFFTGLLTLGSLNGILDTLKGKGISFDKLVADFNYEPDVLLTISDARMKGDSIGGTVEGTVDLATEDLKLKGKIIPAYSANTLLGKVPILGDILIGDDGVFALSYTVKGTIDKPDQTVNPLSVLAPGFLQMVFE